MNGQTRRRPGRPALPSEDRLSELLATRATKAEADSAHRAAFRLGLTTAEYIRVKLGFRNLETLTKIA